MADNDIAVQDQSQQAVQEPPFQYEIKIEDAGPATKKVSIEIPQERIAAKLEEQFKDCARRRFCPASGPATRRAG